MTGTRQNAEYLRGHNGLENIIRVAAQCADHQRGARTGRIFVNLAVSAAGIKAGRIRPDPPLRSLARSQKVGLAVSVFVQVTLEKQIELSLANFERSVRDRPEVTECYLTTGDADYLIRVVMPDLPTFERFMLDHLTKIPGIASIKSNFALKQVKYQTALPLPDNA